MVCGTAVCSPTPCKYYSDNFPGFNSFPALVRTLLNLVHAEYRCKYQSMYSLKKDMDVKYIFKTIFQGQLIEKIDP